MDSGFRRNDEQNHSPLEDRRGGLSLPAPLDRLDEPNDEMRAFFNNPGRPRLTLVVFCARMRRTSDNHFRYFRAKENGRIFHAATL